MELRYWGRFVFIYYDIFKFDLVLIIYKENKKKLNNDIVNCVWFLDS